MGFYSPRKLAEARKGGQMAFCSTELHPIKALGAVEKRECHGHRASAVALETVSPFFASIQCYVFIVSFSPLSTYLYLEYVNTSRGGGCTFLCLCVS